MEQQERAMRLSTEEKRREMSPGQALGDFQRGGSSNIPGKVTRDQDVHQEANSRRDSEPS